MPGVQLPPKAHVTIDHIDGLVDIYSEPNLQWAEGAVPDRSEMRPSFVACGRAYPAGQYYRHSVGVKTTKSITVQARATIMGVMERPMVLGYISWQAIHQQLADGSKCTSGVAPIINGKATITIDPIPLRIDRDRNPHSETGGFELYATAVSLLGASNIMGLTPDAPYYRVFWTRPATTSS